MGSGADPSPDREVAADLVEYLVLHVPEPSDLARIGTELERVVESAAIRVLDLVVLRVDHEGATSVALDFIDALEQAYTHISRHPGTGSPRHGHELDLPGLRSWTLSRYPYLIFYIERQDHIDVWRVLHGQRDIPAWMQDPDACG